MQQRDVDLAKRIFKFDEEGRARGQCNNCDCFEWLAPNASSTNGDFVAREPRAYNAFSKTPHTVNLKADCVFWRPALGQRLPQFPAGGPSCLRCGCAAPAHEDLSEKVMRLRFVGALSKAEAGWSDLERLLFWQTDGAFHPERGSSAATNGIGEPGGPGISSAAASDVLVSVICPTGGRRRKFHPMLYQCFSSQEHPAKQLIVVETAADLGPSEFFSSGPPSKDSRVIYRYFDIPEKHWSIGTKRNIACYLATGEVIAHFDDDDLYTPQYLTEMLQALMRGCCSSAGISVAINTASSLSLPLPPPNPNFPVELIAQIKQQDKLINFEGPGDDDAIRFTGIAAEATTLSKWHTFHLKTGNFGVYDVEKGAPHDQNWTYGFGFKFIYLRAAWHSRGFRNKDLGEDQDFLEGLMLRGARVAVFSDSVGLCAHTDHASNTCIFEPVQQTQAQERQGSLVKLGDQLRTFIPALSTESFADHRTMLEEEHACTKQRAQDVEAWHSSAFVEKAYTLVQDQLIIAFSRPRDDVEMGLISLAQYIQNQLKIEMTDSELRGVFFQQNPDNMEPGPCDSSMLHEALFEILKSKVCKWCKECRRRVECHRVINSDLGIAMKAVGLTHTF